jgi:hypothetical protein
MKEINSNDWIELRDYVAGRFIIDSETFSEVLFRGHIVFIENDIHEEVFRLWIDLPISVINEKNITKVFGMNSSNPHTHIYGNSLWYVIEYIHENVKNETTMDITVPPFDDLDENGNYIGNDINFLIKNDNSKNEILDKFHNFSFDDLRLFKSQVFILNNDEWEKLISKLIDNHFLQLKKHYDFDTVEIQNYIFKKSN